MSLEEDVEAEEVEVEAEAMVEEAGEGKEERAHMSNEYFKYSLR